MLKSHRVRLLLMLATAAAATAAFLLLPVGAWLVTFLEWVRGLGAWGPVLVAASYVVACLLFVPGSVLTMGSGFLFGVALGTATVSVGSTLGAAAAFLAGRTLARGVVEAKVAGSPKFRAIDRAIERHGFKIVLLTRLSPVFPFNLLNYAYGLTGVSFWRYVLASWIGMLPGTVMYVYLGATVRNLSDLAAGRIEAGTAHYILFGIGLAATVAVTALVTRAARAALREAVPEAGPPEGAPEEKTATAGAGPDPA